MTFNWSEYLNLARELTGKVITPASQEAKLRSAISRSYYAAFIQARNFLREQEHLTIPPQNTHQYVMNQFKNSSETARQGVGRRLQRLRDYRNRADYDDTVSGLAGKSQEALGLARRIISGLANL